MKRQRGPSFFRATAGARERIYLGSLVLAAASDATANRHSPDRAALFFPG
jgi:hypothetical protein